MDDIRGIVISGSLDMELSGLVLKTRTFDEQELRAALLFWDRLNFPETNSLQVVKNAEADFLEQAGVLERHYVATPGSGPIETVTLKAQRKAFLELDAKEPGVWAVGSLSGSSPFQPEDLEPGRGLLVRLYRAVPVPDQSVPLQDILEFRARRRPELLAFRHHLERMYQAVMSSNDVALSIRTEVEALDRAIADYTRSSKGMLGFVRAMSLDASFNIPAALSAGATVSSQLGITRGLAAGLVAGLSIGPSAALLGRTPSPRPFRYVSAYHRDVFEI